MTFEKADSVLQELIEERKGLTEKLMKEGLDEEGLRRYLLLEAAQWMADPRTIDVTPDQIDQAELSPLAEFLVKLCHGPAEDLAEYCRIEAEHYRKVSNTWPEDSNFAGIATGWQVTRDRLTSTPSTSGIPETQSPEDQPA